MTLPNVTLGYTFSCPAAGLDASFRLCETDAQIVTEECERRLTTRSVLGDTPEAIDFGENIFELCGDHVSDAEIPSLGPRLGGVLQKSPIIEHADVVVTRGTRTDLIDLFLEVTVTPKNPTTDEIGTSLSFFFRLTGDTFQRVGNPDGNAET
jgi:hypothetical protein